MGRVAANAVSLRACAVLLLGVLALGACARAPGRITAAGPGAAGATTATSPAPPGEDTTQVATTTTAPPPPLASPFDAIAARLGLTPEGSALLARSSPKLVDRSQLGATCTLDLQLNVLGCHSPGSITVLGVTDPRLDGMVETTTAHELLHAAWATLEPAERDRLTEQLIAEFEIRADPDLRARVDAYRAQDPSVVPNELHSILGTELSGLSPVLEEHYRRWFSDRAAVAALATSSIATFDDLRRRVEELDDRIESERRTLDAAEVRLNSRSTDLARREADIESLADSGRIDEYNADVGGFNADVDAYNRALRSHREAVEAFNRRVDERNELAAAYSDLAAQIDTAATPLPQR